MPRPKKEKKGVAPRIELEHCHCHISLPVQITVIFHKQAHIFSREFPTLDMPRYAETALDHQPHDICLLLHSLNRAHLRPLIEVHQESSASLLSSYQSSWLVYVIHGPSSLASRSCRAS